MGLVITVMCPLHLLFVLYEIYSLTACQVSSIFSCVIKFPFNLLLIVMSFGFIAVFSTVAHLIQITKYITFSGGVRKVKMFFNISDICIFVILDKSENIHYSYLVF